MGMWTVNELFGFFICIQMKHSHSTYVRECFMKRSDRIVSLLVTVPSALQNKGCILQSNGNHDCIKSFHRCLGKAGLEMMSCRCSRTRPTLTLDQHKGVCTFGGHGTGDLRSLCHNGEFPNSVACRTWNLCSLVSVSSGLLN